jgi:hypothetical protein
MTSDTEALEEATRGIHTFLLRPRDGTVKPVSFRGRQPFIQLPRLKLGCMSGRRQIQLILCVACLLTTVVIVVSAILPPVGASRSAAFGRPHFSNQAKTPLHLANSLELDIPAPGSIESPWDAGSIWDEEASAYDPTQSAQ